MGSGPVLAVLGALAASTSIAYAGNVTIVCVERSTHAQNTEKITFDFDRRLVISHDGWGGDRGRNLPLQISGSILSWTDGMDYPNEVDSDTGEMHRMVYGAVVATLDCRLGRRLF